MERLALFDSDFKLNIENTNKVLQEIEKGSNIMELIEQDML